MLRSNRSCDLWCGWLRSVGFKKLNLLVEFECVISVWSVCVSVWYWLEGRTRPLCPYWLQCHVTAVIINVFRCQRVSWWPTSQQSTLTLWPPPKPDLSLPHSLLVEAPFPLSPSEIGLLICNTWLKCVSVSSDESARLLPEMSYPKCPYFLDIQRCSDAIFFFSIPVQEYQNHYFSKNTGCWHLVDSSFIQSGLLYAHTVGIKEYLNLLIFVELINNSNGSLLHIVENLIFKTVLGLHRH